jgi:hypothetical protein
VELDWHRNEVIRTLIQGKLKDQQNGGVDIEQLLGSRALLGGLLT